MRKAGVNADITDGDQQTERSMEKSVTMRLNASVNAKAPTTIQLNRKKRQAASIFVRQCRSAVCMPAN